MRLTGLALLCAVLAGCTVVDPNRHAPELLAVSASPPADAGAIARTRWAIRRQELSYVEAATEIERIRSLGPLAAALAATAGGALALTTTGSTDLQSGLVLGAAGLLGATSLYGDRVRQEVYRNAGAAMRCLWAETAPLEGLPIAEARAVLAELNLRAASLLRLRESGVVGTRWSNQEVDALLASAETARRALAQLAHLEAVVAQRLEARAGDIRDAIDRDISRGVADPLLAFQMLTGGQAGLAGVLPAPLGTAPDARRGVVSGALVEPPLDEAARHLRETLGRARDLVERLRPLESVSFAQRCAPPSVPNPLRVSPAGATQILSADGSELRFDVSGGVGNRRARFIGDRTGFALRQTIGNDGELAVFVKAEAAAAGRTVVLAFSDERGVTLRQVELVAPPSITPPPRTPRPNPPVASGNPAAEAPATGPKEMLELTPRQARLVRRGLGLIPLQEAVVAPADACAPPLPATPDTLPAEAVTALVRDHGATESEARALRLLRATYNKLAEETLKRALDVNAHTVCETSRVADNNLARIYCILGVKMPTDLTAEAARPAVLAFRRALFARQQASSRVEITGLLDSGSEAILNAGPRPENCR